MPLLKVGHTYINTDRIVSVATPTKEANAVRIRIDGDDDLTVAGEEAEVVRQWLASQVEPTPPATVPFVTKADPQPTNKSTPRR